MVYLSLNRLVRCVVLINGQAQDIINKVINMSRLCAGAKYRISGLSGRSSQGSTTYYHPYIY